MFNRRDFLRSTAAVSAGFLAFRSSVQARESATTRGVESFVNGSLVPDTKRLLDLPEGFSCSVISQTGRPMDDGLLVPGNPDGAAAFAGPTDLTLLVMNHEMQNETPEMSPFASDGSLLSKIDRTRLYDDRPALGGTSTIVFDTREQKVVRHFLSLGGTVRNCAGGPTPWGSWITCEEDVSGPDKGFQKHHGYNFEVPATAEPILHQAVPLKAMGRFNHEAIAVDPRSGIVYQTEDRNDGLIYRFIPNAPGKLIEGGRLQALRVRGRKSFDTRNWDSPAQLFAGETVDVDWIDIENVESPEDDLRHQGFSKGAARFARGEGMWQGRSSIFFACTNGGSAKKGQIWRYVPSPFEGTNDEKNYPGRLELFIEPNDAALVDNADNLCVSPRGHLFVCEDGSGENRIVVVRRDGSIATFARNAHNNSELAGVCFSPDGTSLFVSIQHDPGITLAITGPWERV